MLEVAYAWEPLVEERHEGKCRKHTKLAAEFGKPAPRPLQGDGSPCGGRNRGAHPVVVGTMGLIEEMCQKCLVPSVSDKTHTHYSIIDLYMSQVSHEN